MDGRRGREVGGGGRRKVRLKLKVGRRYEDRGRVLGRRKKEGGREDRS
jgi:hypothetical protein